MNIKFKKIHILNQTIDLLLKSAKKFAPLETCGILIGMKNNISSFISITNISTDRSKFIFDPDEYIKALFELENSDVQQLGIYHSHPFGPSYPSETDLSENISDGQVQIIISPEANKWVIKTFQIFGYNFTEIKIRVELSE